MSEQFSTNLSDVERAAIQNPALRQQAKAIQKLTELGYKGIVTPIIVEQGIEAVRGMNKNGAKKLRREIAKASETLSWIAEQRLQSEPVQFLEPYADDAESDEQQSVGLQTLTDEGSISDEETAGEDPVSHVEAEPSSFGVETVGDVIDRLVEQKLEDVASELGIDTTSEAPGLDEVKTAEAVQEQEADEVEHQGLAPESEVEKKPISDRGVTLMNQLFGRGAIDKLGLTLDDAESVAELIVQLRGEGRYDPAQYTERLTRFFQGWSDAKIAKDEGLKGPNLSTFFYQFRMKLLNATDYSVDRYFERLRQMKEAQTDPAQLAREAEIRELVAMSPIGRKPIPKPSEIKFAPKAEPTPVPAWPEDVEVAIVSAESVDEVDEVREWTDEELTERRALLDTINRAVDTPKVVTPVEWLTAAEEYVRQGFARFGGPEQAHELWNWIHLHDTVAQKNLGNDGRDAIKTLQQWFFERGKDVFAKQSVEDTAARSLLVTANGYNDLDVIAKFLNRRDHKITKHIAQRYVVKVVAELIDDRETLERG